VHRIPQSEMRISECGIGRARADYEIPATDLAPRSAGSRNRTTRPQSAFRNPRVALRIPQYVVRLVWDTRQSDRLDPFASAWAAETAPGSKTAVSLTRASYCGKSKQRPQGIVVACPKPLVLPTVARPFSLLDSARSVSVPRRTSPAPSGPADPRRSGDGAHRRCRTRLRRSGNGSSRG